MALGSSISAHAEYECKNIECLKLREILTSPTFTDNKLTIPEQVLLTFNNKIIETCETQEKANNTVPDYCLFPDIYEEFQSQGKILVNSSFDKSNLALTLAGRIHPTTLSNMYLEDVQSFDRTYARFLVAQRLLKEVYQKVPEELQLSQDTYLTTSWLTSRTASSFLLNLSRKYSCVSFDASCKEKRLIIGLLQKIYSVVNIDQELLKIINAAVDETQLVTQDKTSERIYKQFIKTLTDESFGYLLVFSSGTGFSVFDRASVQSYFDNVETESKLPLVELPSFVGEPCSDLSRSLFALKNNEVLWATEVPITIECQAENGRFYSLSGPTYEYLADKGLVWRFNFLQLRLMIIKLFDSRKEISSRDLQISLIHESLQDFLEVKTVVEKMPKVNLNAYDLEKLKPQLAFVYNSILEHLDRLDALLQNQ
jgi:hypothetical protein